MKKILLFGGALALLSPYASCGNNPDSGVNEPDSNVNESDSSVNEKVDCECKGKEALEGLSVGFGPLVSRNMSKASNIEDVYENDRLNVAYAAAPSAADISSDFMLDGFDADSTSLTFDGRTAVGGAYTLTSVRARNSNYRQLAENKTTGGGGALTLRYGKFVTGNFYVGLQGLIDITGNKEKQERDNSRTGYGLVRNKTNGLKPSLSILFGGYCNPLDTLICLKVGCAFQKAEATSEFGNVKMSGLAPLAGVDIRKNLVNGWSVALNVDYIFQKDTDGYMSRPVTVRMGTGGPGMAPVPQTLSHKSKIRLRNKGFNARVLFEHKI